MIIGLETLFYDLRYGLRQLRKAPVLLAVAVFSLALGIGANTAIFTLIDAVMRQSLPVRDPQQLVLFYDGISAGVNSGNGFPGDIFSYPAWKYLHAHNDSFESLCAFRQGDDRVSLHVPGSRDTGPTETANVHLVSGNYFAVLGVSAAAGRVLQTEDDSPSAPRAAVISYRFWQNRFHLDRGTVGKEVLLNGTAFTIAGVAAPEFFGERVRTPPDFWLPLSFQPQILPRESSWLTAWDVAWLNLMGRLKPGVTQLGAQAGVNVRLHQFYLEQAGAHPSRDTLHKIESAQVTLKPGGGGISGLRFLYSQPLHILMAVVALVLLIACANVATLVMSRASSRRREFLARLALGASPARLLRQVLTESVLLSFLGGIAGVGVAWGCVRFLIHLLGVNSVVKIRPDPSVLAFTFSISLLAGVAFGILPAIACSRTDPRPGAAVRPVRFGRLRFESAGVLIVVQVTLSLVLLFGSGLLVHSLFALVHQEIGFTRENVLLVKTDPRLAGYRPNALLPLYRRLDEQLNRIPGVTSASIARYTPESGTSSSSNLSIEGYVPPPGKQMNVSTVEVGPHFLDTLRIPILRGRAIGPRDTPASPAVAVVNRTFVDTYFPNENPLGRHFGLGAPFRSPGVEIVGVVKDSRYYDLREKPEPMAFFPIWQDQRSSSAYAGDILLRSTHDAAGLTPEVRQAIRRVDPKLPILEVTTLDRQVDQSLKQEHVITTLCSAFGGIALLLACIGIYGTMAYSVARRTTEIGVRMALGAPRANVLWTVLADSVLLISTGLVLGVPAAFAAARWIKSFLFGVASVDPIAIEAATALILVFAFLAAYLPARRVTKIDPMRALRYE